MSGTERQSVLFFTPFGEWQVHNQLDVTVAAALEARGVGIYYLICDGAYQPCAITRGQQDCARCQAVMATTLASQSVDSSPLRAFMTQDDVARADAWMESLPNEALATARFDDLPVGQWALSSIMTQFRISQIQHLDQPHIVPAHRRFLRDTLLTFWAILRVLDQQRFEALFLFNGRFYPYRAAMEAARRRGLRVLVHERGRVPNSFAFFENENVFGSETAQRLIDAWCPVALDAIETQRLEDHFSRMLMGENNTWPAFYDQVRFDNPYAILDIPDGARLIGFFTSSSDEFAFQPGFGDVKRQFGLIEDIARILEGTDTFLVVRHHPNIAGGTDTPCDRTGFEEAFRQALNRQKNLRIIMPADQLTSYALFPFLTAAVVPFSSIAMELMAFGVPTLVSDISEIGFDERFILRNWSQQNVVDAMRLLLSREAELDVDKLRLFYRRCYSLLFRFSVVFRLIEIERFFHTVSRFEGKASLLPGEDAALDRVCDQLLTGSPVHPRPDRTRTANSEKEDRFIARQAALIAERKQALGGRPAETAPPGSQPTLAVLVDESVRGHVGDPQRRDLANARTFSVSTLGNAISRDRLQGLSMPTHEINASDDFVSWCRRLSDTLGKTDEEFVLISNPRFQFHDTSIASIAEAIRSLQSLDVSLIYLSGWAFDCERQSYAKAELTSLASTVSKQPTFRLSTPLRPRDSLCFMVSRRVWLIEILDVCLRKSRTEREFEQILLSRAAKQSAAVSMDQPTFLLI
jgi:hypothetical protein